MRLSTSAGWFLLFSVCFILFLVGVSCGGGGGSGDGADFGFSGSGFGFDDFFGNTTGAGTSNDYPILNGVNLPIVLYFNEALDPTTVNSQSIDVKTITVPDADDPNDLVDVAGGKQASVEYVVIDSALYIFPTLSFDDGLEVFGFREKAAYEIKFAQEPAPQVITSQNGNPLVLPLGKPIAFITTDTVYDHFAGAPEPRFYYDENSNPNNPSWVELDENVPVDGEGKPIYPSIPIVPLPHFRVYYSEPVQVTWGNVALVNKSDNTSDVLQVLYYGDAPGETQPIYIPGTWELTQEILFSASQSLHAWTMNGGRIGQTYVEFVPNSDMVAIPPGELVHLIGRGLVADLSGLTKGELLGDPNGVKDVRNLNTTGNIALNPIVEDFSTQEFSDEAKSSAVWGEFDDDLSEFYLFGSGGGGNGSDGSFKPPEFLPGNIDPQEVTELDLENQIVYLPTAEKVNEEWQQLEYNFTEFNVPSGWTVKPKLVDEESGRIFPLTIFVTGDVNIFGTLDVGGQQGENMVIGSVPSSPDSPHIYPYGSPGGISHAGGAPGGQGGSIPYKENPTTLDLAWERFEDEFGNPVFQDPGIHENIAGISGVISEMGDFWLIDETLDPSELTALEEELPGQILAPNVGLGEFGLQVVTNRPIYVVKRVEPANKKICVWGCDPGDETDPRYNGIKFTEFQGLENKDIWLGVPYPLPTVAWVGSPFIVGHLSGEPGLDPYDDPANPVFRRGGQGGDPLAVAQTQMTQASGGAGGGASARTEGQPGAVGADFDPIGTMGGLSRPAEGGMKGDQGFLTGEIVSVAPLPEARTELELSLTLTPGAALPSSLDGCRINPNTEDLDPVTSNDWQFTIVSTVVAGDSLIVTVDPLSSSNSARQYLPTDPEVGCGNQKLTPFIVYPPNTMGGAGGGGSGIVLTGTSKFAYFNLPYWKQGAGGGAGGGVLFLESAHSITVSTGGAISAEGGKGGTNKLPGVGADGFPGGGGGSGGTINLRAQDGIFVNFGATISAAGGKGGGTDILGGTGGHGYLRIENEENNLDPINFLNGRSIPEVGEAELGKFLAQGVESVGLSGYYPSGVISPEYLSLQIIYRMEIDGVPVSEDLYYTLGTEDPDHPSANYPADPPFRILLNGAEADPETGLINASTMDNDFVEWSEFETTNEGFFRFLMSIWNVYEPSDTTSIYGKPRIYSVTIQRIQAIDP